MMCNSILKSTGAFLVFLFITSASNSQGKKLSVDYKSSLMQVEKAVTVDPKTIATDFDPRLQNLEMPYPGGPSVREQLLLKKQYLEKKYPKRQKSGTESTRGAGDTIPYKGKLFEGNLSGNGVPNDNDVAISDDGYLVSVINSNIYMYDVENDSLLYNTSLGAFTLPLNIQNSKYDPKIVYDPMAQRFILVFLNGTTYQTSKVIICFSSTSNPLDPWHLYKLNGNPLNNNTWSDYPVIGISATDLYIGVNTFFNGSTNNSGFYESCFWQVALYDGYAGDTLRTAYYSDIAAPADTLFNICPIHTGAENLNQDMFLLSNKNLSVQSDTFYLLRVTEPLINGNPQLEVTLINANKEYFLPPTASQPNGHTFDTNDSRVLGGFESNGTIQFVQSTLDTATGLAGIYHGFINDIYGLPVITANIISDTTRDYGFPNIAWTGYYPGEGESLITFNYVSPSDFAGMGAVYFMPDSSYSEMAILQTGNAVIDVLSGTYERWGDYSGIQRRYNQPCRVWAAGSFAKAGNKHGTWIAEIGTSDSCSVNPFASAESELKKEAGLLLYPNPVNDRFTLEFEMENPGNLIISLYDLNGKVVIDLLRERAKAGRNQFSFSTTPLVPGIYMLSIRGDNGTLIQTVRVVKL